MIFKGREGRDGFMVGDAGRFKRDQHSAPNSMIFKGRGEVRDRMVVGDAGRFKRDQARQRAP
jgi:hypothetical protein